MNGEKTLDISWETILRISLALFCFYLFYLARDILIGFFFALIVSILFEPAIRFFQRLRLPRILATLLVYVGTFLILSALIYYSSTLFIYEVRHFSFLLPQYFEKIAPPLRGLGFEAFESIEKFLEVLEVSLGTISSNIFNALFAFFGGIFSTIFVITVAIAISLEADPIPRVLRFISPEEYEDYVFSLFEKCQKRIAGWFLARVIAALFVGLASFLIFLLFEIDYPFTLALLAAALEFIPTIGPLLTGVIAFLLVVLESLPRAVFVLISFTLVQQIEGNILTPLLMRRFIGVPTVLVLLALAIGGKLWGFLGAILAVPLVGILFEFSKEFLKERKEGRV